MFYFWGVILHIPLADVLYLGDNLRLELSCIRVNMVFQYSPSAVKLKWHNFHTYVYFSQFYINHSRLLYFLLTPIKKMYSMAMISLFPVRFLQLLALVLIHQLHTHVHTHTNTSAGACTHARARTHTHTHRHSCRHGHQLLSFM
jgi:hypothetical protein